MAQTIFTNMASLNSQRHLNNSQSALSTSLERLSSGKRINSAKDDAAGLGIAERMTAQIQGMNQAIRNANDGISMMQTAEGALDTSLDMIERVRVLAIQSSNATNSVADRQALQDEVNELTAELNRIAVTTKFNGQNILDGSMGAQIFQVGAFANETITATGTNFQTHVYGNNRMYGQATANSTVWLNADANTGTAVGDQALHQFAEAWYTEDITVSGRYGSADITVGQYNTAGEELIGGMTAKQLARAINEVEGQTGVTASAKTEGVISNLTAGAAYSFDIVSNNTTAINVNFTIGNSGDSDAYAEAINAINAASAKTGVIASYYSDVNGVVGIKITNDTGENVRLVETHRDASATTAATLRALVYSNATDEATLSAAANINGVTPGDFTTIPVPAVDLPTGGATLLGTVSLDSQSSYSVTTTSTVANAAVTNAEWAATRTGSAISQLKAVATLDVTTFNSAQLAISICDAAIDVINSERARFGALQARFEATISNLQINSENTSNARSRIEDADYAEETANMSRATILQQAGIAMLAQANQIPQMVLSLIG